MEGTQRTERGARELGRDALDRARSWRPRRVSVQRSARRQRPGASEQQSRWSARGEAGVVLGEGAGIASGTTQVAQESVDDRGIEDEGDDLHRGAAARTAERVDLEDALQEFGPALTVDPQRRPVGHGVTGSSGDLLGRPRVAQDAGAAPAGAPTHRVGTVVTHEDLVGVGDMRQQAGEELEGGEVVGAGGRPVALVGGESDGVLVGQVLQPLERDGGARGVAGELEDALGIVGFEPDGMVDVEAGVGLSEHGARVIGGEELATDELAQHSAPEGLGQDVDVVEAEVEEGAVGPEGARR
jgi:hypothetical protein